MVESGGSGPGGFEVPGTFREMPRWWAEGRAWLDGLPAAVAAQCERWGLRPDGEPRHGSNALVVPVTRRGERFVLRMTPPGPAVAAEVAALRFWAGRGTARLHEADVAAGAMLLERLDMDGSLAALPVDEAMPVLGTLMRRLAVPAPAEAASTAAAALAAAHELEPEWDRGRIDRAFVAAAMTAAPALTVAPVAAAAATDLAVDGDLHSAQVLRGGREPWLVVDPVLMRGDIEYDLARVLWTRLDEMAAIVPRFDAVVDAAGLDRDRARDWVVLRAADYWRWGLDHGLTGDPVRCRRLLAALT